MNDDEFKEKDFLADEEDKDAQSEYTKRKTYNILSGDERQGGSSKAMTLSVLLIVGLIVLSCTVFLWPRHDRTFDHTRVGITVQNNTCFGNWTCDGCTDIQKEYGCCRGCNPDVPPLNACSFFVTLEYENVTSYSVPQRVWLFASLDGINYYTTGYAPYVETLDPFQPASGSAVVQDGCFGGPDNQIILVACLSDRNLKDQNFIGFPATQCNSTKGICVNSNNVGLQDIHQCEMGNWEPNEHETTWTSAWYGTTGDFSPIDEDSAFSITPFSPFALCLITFLSSLFLFPLFSSPQPI